MLGSAIHGFTDPDEYRAHLRPWMDEFVVSRPGVFSARLIQVELPNVNLLRAWEVLPRVACLSCPAETVLISFPTHPNGRPLWAGVELRLGELMFHSLGVRVHQRTTGPSFWGCLMMRAATLELYGKALTGEYFGAPPTGRILRPEPSDWRRLLHLHARIGRVAETQSSKLGHLPVAHAMEQEVIEALVPCLASGDAHDKQGAGYDQTQIMIRFEEVVASYADRRPPPLADLGVLVGVSERSLQSYCAKCLGMSAGRYLHLRRLTLVRTAMLQIDPATAQFAKIALRYGFTDPGRLAASYRLAFGETPLATLRRTKNLWR
jgi:AraC-like DNA-binding protein